MWTYNLGGNGGAEATELTQKLIAPFGMVWHMDRFRIKKKNIVSWKNNDLCCVWSVNTIAMWF